MKHGITEKLRILVTDNTSNNNIIAEELAREIKSFSILDRGFYGRYIINLIVKAILYSKGLSWFERELIGASNKDEFNL